MINILITQSGGPAAIGLIKSIRQSSYDVSITSTDMDKLATGNYFSDYYYTVPPTTHSNYIKTLLNLVKKHKIDLIIPTGENDLQKLSDNKKEFEECRCKLFISNSNTIETCQDKFKFYEFLKDKDVPLPLTINKPVIIKPNKESGSRGIKVLDLKNQILQEHLPGKEYTVDVFCDMNSKIISHIIRERIAVKSGISVKGKILQNPNISSIIIKLVKYLDLKGPVCIQFKENESGEPVIIECNPRLGGGTYMCTLAGVNYADIYFDLLTNTKRATPNPKEITVLRYYNEIII